MYSNCAGNDFWSEIQLLVESDGSSNFFGYSAAIFERIVMLGAKTTNSDSSGKQQRDISSF